MSEKQMPETAETSAAQAVSQLDQSYDAEVKNFLKEKSILAVILKSCVKEFRNSSCRDIAEKYIEGMPQVSAVAVDQDVEAPAKMQAGSKIEGMSGEDTSRNEGRVVYDIRFTALAPKDGSRIKLIINVEAQREAEDLKYPIVKRGIYYAARLISAQKNVEFKHSDYQNIRKVYSIWICQNVAKAREHSILTYDMRENLLFGSADTQREKKENYDLLSVVLLGLGSPDRRDTDDALRMLSAALSGKLDAERKKQILAEDFGIPMTETIERSVNYMCNLSYGIRVEGRAEGREEGLAEGREEGRAEGRREGRAEGRREGRQEGQLIMLYDLVKDGILTLSAAAARVHQDDSEFRAGMDRYFASVG